MINIQLPTGNTISVSVYEYYFMLDDNDMDLFYQSCMADDLGRYIDNPFSKKKHSLEIKEEDEEDIKDVI